MQNDLVRVPVLLVRVSTNEIFAASFVAGIVVTIAYQVGKASQRRWFDKQLSSILNKKEKS